MNNSQKQTILDTIEKFQQSDFSSVFAAKYKDSASTKTIVAADYTISELLALSKRAVQQLKKRLNEIDWQVLPVSFSYVDLGNASVNQCLINIINNLKSASYDNAAKNIKALVYFEMNNGFWTIPPKIELGIRESSLAKLEERASLVMSHIDERGKKAEDTIESLLAKKKEIEDLLATKKKEFETIRSNQSTSNTVVSQIQNTQKNVEQLYEQANKEKNECEVIKKELNGLLNTHKEKENEINVQLEVSKKILDDINTQLQEKHHQVDEIYDYVSTKKEEVVGMMGTIADGSLSRSFNTRCEKLRKQKNIWLWVSIVMAFLAALWVCVVFIWLKANTGNEWANLVINAIKSSPMFVILGFSMTQYQKERNLLEEYAYRETIAVTLNAYADQVEKAKEENKRNILTSTIEKLYTKPIIGSKENETLKLDSKSLPKFIKSLESFVLKLKGLEN